MSHLVNSGAHITSLDALADAAAECGMELVRGQTTHKWYGRFVGDSPMMEGFSREDLGKCEHAIRVKSAPAGAYEIGVVPRRDGEQGYLLIYDSWGQGGGAIEACAGKGLARLKTEHHVAVARRTYRGAWRMQREQLADGRVRVRLQQ